MTTRIGGMAMRRREMISPRGSGGKPQEEAGNAEEKKEGN